MSTLILNLNDTVAMSDSTLIELAKLVNASHPCVQEAATNWLDFAIAAIICVSVVVIACYGICRFFSNKEAERAAQENANEEKKTKDEADKKAKQKSDMTDKLVDFLKDQASSKNNDAKPNVSLAIDDVCKYLEESAEVPAVEGLRKQLVNLCTTLIKNNKGEKNNDNTESKSAKTGKKEDPSKDTNAETYVNALCTLIGLMDKEQWDKDDIDNLKKSCGLEINPSQANPQTVTSPKP